MRINLTCILLILAFLQVSAGSFAQKITISRKNASIIEVFVEIKKQSGYDFVYKNSLFKQAKSINIDVRNEALITVLEKCFSDQPFTYAIENRTIIVKPKEKSITDKIVSFFQKDSVNVKGTIVDEKGSPLSGASVKVKGSNRTRLTSKGGNFTIYAPFKGTLIVTYIGYATKEISLAGINLDSPLNITMNPGQNQLGEVNIVSTGYQDIPRERATGSFEVITKEQLQHSTDPNLVKRLEGITTSLDFNNNSQFNPTNSADLNSRQSNNSPLARLTIRGRNTLNNPLVSANNSSGVPLVVIDGIASPYSIDQINPNDVENITILKDAAAASIWGSRAANGVIVVKTKKEGYENPLKINFNTNVNITEKVNLFYKKTMSISDYIDAQILAYNKQYDPNNPNAYIGDPVINNSQTAISPVADIMNQQKRGQITAAQANFQLDALRNKDIRNDYSKYLLRDAVTQSYSLAISGGSKVMAQRLSAGYDKILNNTVNSGSNKLVLNYGVSAKPLPKLELQSNITYIQQNTNGQSAFTGLSGTINNTLYPYISLVDTQGNPAVVTKSYSPQFLKLLSNTYGDKILDYTYRPLNEINDGSFKNKMQTINLNFGAIYKILPSFSANIAYNYNAGSRDGVDIVTQDSWYVRDLINRFTDPTTTPFTRNFPLGGIYTPTVGKSNGQTLRGQLNLNKTWNEKHNFYAIAGMDISQTYNYTRGDQYYGYNGDLLSTSKNLDFKTTFKLLFGDSFSGLAFSRIPTPNGSINESRVRTISYYSNAAYTFDNRYTLSASLRRDLSSLYGVGGDKGGTPFFSVGGSWNIANEKFYSLDWLPYLRFRATYGYNGNVNPATAAVPILSYVQAETVTNGNRLAYATAINASNNQLRPEKTGIINFGLDFGTKNNRISGSLEYYKKKTKDLIVTNTVDPSTGFSSLLTNTGNLDGKGAEFTLNSLNFQSGLFKWNSNFLFSYNRVKVTKLYSAIAKTAGRMLSASAFNEGYDLTNVFAFKWAGLDSNTGDPRGYLNGNIVTIDNTPAGSAAASGINNAPVNTLHYFGSATPVYYGSFRNTFSYGNLSVSANLLYKLGYWFRRSPYDLVNYSVLFSDNRLQPAEYANRWQKPGDEKFTNVPSLTYPGNSNKDYFYSFSDINVLKGDHVRLQEINVSYAVNKKKWFIKNPRIYANVSNLGVIWRANKLGIDPDVFDYQNPKTYSLGLSANF